MAEVRNYQVLITPLESKNTYGTELDVTQDIDLSDYIKAGGIGKIKREIDNGDFDIGVFTYGNINLKAINFDGRFNTEADWRSIFKYSRDKAKIKIKFFKPDGTSVISFKGIINEEGTKQNFKKAEVKFRVLAQDSVIRKTKVAGGTITTGTLYSLAIKQIINVPDITSILTYSAANINVGLDLTIDDGSWFDNKTTKEALDALLVVSGSVMIIDSSDNMIVRTRTENTEIVYNLFGIGDIHKRENILDIKNYNSGYQRMFNSVVVNGTEVNDPILISAFGVKQKIIEYAFLTDDTKEAQVANNILTEFKVNKVEMEVIVATETAKDMDLFDLISVNYPYIISPADGAKLPVYGVAKYGTAQYPRISGTVKINPNEAYKIIGFKEDPKKFQTIVKLRQRGITLSDGMFTDFLSIYGSAIYGSSVYQESNDPDPNTKSAYGAAKYGTVTYGPY